MSNYTFSRVETFTKGKQPPKNEDYAAHTETDLFLSDGATDKSGRTYGGRTGGELAAETVIEACLASSETGEALIRDVTLSLQALYKRVNPEALENSALRFGATLVAARIVEDTLVVTQVGDTSFRINGKETFTNRKIVDELTAATRKHYIELTNDIEGGRTFILPLIREQHIHQNKTTTPLGHGVLDGTMVPAEFIKTFHFPAEEIKTIEIVSDGYYDAFPKDVSIEAYENLFEEIQRTDPYKYIHYPSTKVSDDRTAIIGTIGKK